MRLFHNCEDTESRPDVLRSDVGFKEGFVMVDIEFRCTLCDKSDNISSELSISKTCSSVKYICTNAIRRIKITKGNPPLPDICCPFVLEHDISNYKPSPSVPYSHDSHYCTHLAHGTRYSMRYLDPHFLHGISGSSKLRPTLQPHKRYI
jgi:hypothetical protein